MHAFEANEENEENEENLKSVGIKNGSSVCFKKKLNPGF